MMTAFIVASGMAAIAASHRKPASVQVLELAAIESHVCSRVGGSHRSMVAMDLYLCNAMQMSASALCCRQFSRKEVGCPKFCKAAFEEFTIPLDDRHAKAFAFCRLA